MTSFCDCRVPSVLLRDARNLSRGTLSTNRIDKSSVTLRGGKPVEVFNEGAYIENIQTINCANGADCSSTDGVVQITIDKVSGEVKMTTHTFLLQSEFTAFTETNTFIAVPGAFDVVGRSTINVTQVQSFNLVPSSVGWTSYNIAISTQNLSPVTTWHYAINNSTVGTNERYSVWITTAFQLYPDYSYSLHVTSTPSAPGLKAAQYGIKIRGYFDTSSN